MLGLVDVTAEGALAGPDLRGIWERVFHDDEEIGMTVPVAPTLADPTPVDAAWLADRIQSVSLDLGRRRLETLLFAQRVSATSAATIRWSCRSCAPTTRSRRSYRRWSRRCNRANDECGGERAQALNLIGNDRRRRVGILQFQGAGDSPAHARAGSLPATASEDPIVD
jgi:hypothetical protein